MSFPLTPCPSSPASALIVSIASIIAFLRRVRRPVITRLDHQNITSFLNIDDIVIVAHLTPDDENLSQRFESVANKYRDRFSFGATEIPAPPAGIGCYNNVDNIQTSTSELSTAESLLDFVKRCSAPLIPQLTRRNELQYLKVSWTLHKGSPYGQREC